MYCGPWMSSKGCEWRDNFTERAGGVEEGGGGAFKVHVETNYGGLPDP